MRNFMTHFVKQIIKGQVSFMLTFFLLFGGGCSQKQESQTKKENNFAVVGIEGDMDSFNPLFAEDVTAGEINDLFYPALTSSKFNSETGLLEYYPLLARAWEFENNDKDIKFHIRSDAKWSDGVLVTAKDVQVSYQLYADTSVASVRQTSVEGLKKSKNGSLDINQAVEVINDTTIIFHFDRPYPGQLFDAGLPILPSHVFQNLPRTSLREDSVNRNPLSAGPFVFEKWKPLEQITLASNSSSTLPHPAHVSQLIFRVIPDYHARLMQLQSGEIDVFPYLNVEDALNLMQTNPKIEIVPLGERFYDAVNWNNIDPDEYVKSKGKRITPNLFFGNPNVRRALTMAINRKEIVESYLQSYGREAVGPISTMFRWAFNDTLVPFPYDPKTAAALLDKEGWRDNDGNGILKKDGRKFSFTLKIPSGNQLRSTIATVIQSQLKAIKIEVKIQQLERSVFWDDLMDKKFDACLAGFSVPLQMQLDELWGSDLEKSRFNLTSFRNKRLNEILIGAKKIKNDTDYAGAWKEFQKIIYDNQPCTFLYWMNDIVAVNKRVGGTSMGVLGTLYHAGDWYIEGGAFAQKVPQQ